MLNLGHFSDVPETQGAQGTAIHEPADLRNTRGSMIDTGEPSAAIKRGDSAPVQPHAAYKKYQFAQSSRPLHFNL